MTDEIMELLLDENSQELANLCRRYKKYIATFEAQLAQTIEDGAGEVEVLEKKFAAMREAAEALVRQMRLMNADPKYQAVWTLFAIHGGQYDGTRCADELEALDAALGRKAAGDK